MAAPSLGLVGERATAPDLPRMFDWIGFQVIS